MDKMNSTNTNENKEKNTNSKTTPTNPTIMIGKLNDRQPTPDSEALTSSDDEGDRQEQIQPAPLERLQVRRKSWLNEPSPILTQPRKASFASSSMSPTTSQPSTPSADPNIWGNQPSNNSGGIVRGHPGPSTFPWGSRIWNNDTRKEPPSRLTEVLPSPALASPLSPNNSYHGDPSNTARDQLANPPIPFAIPLHPTPKTYRSQSYSVGQLDLDSPASTTSHAGTTFSGRSRALQHSGLPHRPSRPSMLSEISNDSFLCKVKEVDDYDDESTSSSSQGTPFQTNEAKTIEILTRENAILRQQQYENFRIRPRSSSSTLPVFNLQGALLEKSDSAIDEFDDVNEHHRDISSKGALGRRLGDYNSKSHSRVSPYYLIENRKLENVKKGFWQSSLGFGGLGDMPQSRRHSFANIPTRHNSVGSISEPLFVQDSALQEGISPKEYPKNYQEQGGYSLNKHIAAYFGGIPSISRNLDIYSTTSYPQQSFYPFTSINQFVATQAVSPHRGMYGAPRPRINQPLYIVLFKCSRPDVFYVQEGTGLSVKPGDLVIVEADRGTDLGTVARANIDWVTAKELKEYYSGEHYKWLMMYSQGASGTVDGTGVGLMAASNNPQGNVLSGMGSSSQHVMQESNSSDIKPKIIKRLAQQHEIQALREKEGNEAKAKRVCMQKVKEHGLHMEILDAEFQMDWKKLTFYYFADSYINFNSLVTDLFKAYKTRIWMSAINPASFANPSLTFHTPSGIGPSVVSGMYPARSPATEQQQQQQKQKPQQSSLHGAERGYQTPYTQNLTHSLDRSMTSYISPPYNLGFSPFFSTTLNNTTSGFIPNESFMNVSAQTDFQGPPAQFPSAHGPITMHKDINFRRESMYIPSKEAWIKGFQGLSMNSR